MSEFSKGSKKQQNAWNNTPRLRKSFSNLQKSPTSSEEKFKEAQKKLQAAVQKHVKSYESSSDEEDLTSENVISNILKSYQETGNDEKYLERTQGFLEDNLHSGASTCLICISRIKRTDSVWNCSFCYCSFHVRCIQRWSKDTIVQKKLALEEQVQIQQIKLLWGCPKCRHDYTPDDIPDTYRCYCQKVVNPEYQPFLAPHSCGETCGKLLKPACGHQCVLLCHPGPCPPCPKTISVPCYCGSKPPKLMRCSNKEWSCGQPCGKPLACDKHKCGETCHSGECNPCPKKSVQKCLCGASQKLRDCSTPLWQCDKVCNKPLSCGNHVCLEKCHIGDCEPCDLSKPRTCPCGKSKFELPCTEDTPPCGDTCLKLLECGLHICHQRCHKEKCGPCLETITKSCRCGLHTKEVQCRKPYFCETKCKRMKDCNKHPCNRKCCDGNCPPCEKPCARSLSCGNHKCSSVCHRGPCYPCNLTETVSCRCGDTQITVPCGRKYKTRPPKCLKLCKLPPECHHEKQEDHRCHFGDCPPCRQVCNKEHGDCLHLCPAPCHSSVLVKLQAQKASMPWEATGPQEEKRLLPCPDCAVPIPVTCFGKHETVDWPCHLARPGSCHKSCGRILLCGNHACSLPCHVVELAEDDVKAGANCEVCENGCTKPRPEPRPDGCQHQCPKPCHSGDCPPCKQMLRIKCHCGLNQPYVACHEWTSSDKKEELQSCGNQCPLNFDCGHRCRANCHSGPCPNSESCKKKVKVFCSCKRIKKEFQCETVRKNLAVVECDEVCLQKQEEERKKNELLNERKKKEEETKNKIELERYEKMFQQKKKNRERRVLRDDNQEGFFMRYRVACGVSIALIACVVYYVIA